METSLTPQDSDRASSDEQVKMMEGGARSSSDESDGTDDPERMVEHYLALQSKLHIIRPDLTEVGNGNKSQKNGKRRNISQKADRVDPRATRLLQKISKLEADILFDHEEAHSRWAETKHQLAKESADRKRLQLDDGIGTQEERADDRIRSRSKGHEKGNMDGEDGTESLADLFVSQPEETPTETLVALQETSGSSGTIVLRDYGKPTGIKPRKILEDACKARDSSSKIIFKQLNPASNHSCRSSLSVKWSREQLMPLSSPTDTVICSSSSRSVTIAMETVSTPSLDQADSYVATVALYLMFSHSPKESNVKLRLPSAWKDLWIELSTQKQNLDEKRAKDDLRDLRKLMLYIASRRDEDGASYLPGKTDIPPAASNGQSSKEEHRPIIAAEEIAKIWSSKASTRSFQQMLTSRRALPIWNFKGELLRSLDKNQVVIVCGETGCGKSTQLPSFILEHQMSSGQSCKIYCAQPRRISAISLARRVSEELGEKRGDLGTSRSLVGYAIRLETKQCAETKLIYATTGVILRLLERSGLEDVTHLLLDEVHERTIDNDFLLIVLRALMTRRPTLKVVLMSATVNALKFAAYFGEAPIVNVPGRTYPVETAYLEDTIQITSYRVDADKLQKPAPSEDSDEDDQRPNTPVQGKAHVLSTKTYSAKTLETLANFNEYRINFDLIVKLLETLSTNPNYVSYSKAILVFLPGLAEIRRLSDMLTKHPEFASGWSVFPLHSTVAIEEQERVFEIPPKGHRKIILSTNIAETGITVPDITCVIDTGKHREMRFDERRQLSRLIDTFISQANATQRRGRAGRVQKGLCFHLFTKARHDTIVSPDSYQALLNVGSDCVYRCWKSRPQRCSAFPYKILC